MGVVWHEGVETESAGGRISVCVCVCVGGRKFTVGDSLQEIVDSLEEAGDIYSLHVARDEGGPAITRGQDKSLPIQM